VHGVQAQMLKCKPQLFTLCKLKTLIISSKPSCHGWQECYQLCSSDTSPA
jgi:hypothetical protein